MAVHQITATVVLVHHDGNHEESDGHFVVKLNTASLANLAFPWPPWDDNPILSSISGASRVQSHGPWKCTATHYQRAPKKILFSATFERTKMFETVIIYYIQLFLVVNTAVWGILCSQYQTPQPPYWEVSIPMGARRRSSLPRPPPPRGLKCCPLRRRRRPLEVRVDGVMVTKVTNLWRVSLE